VVSWLGQSPPAKGFVNGDLPQLPGHGDLSVGREYPWRGTLAIALTSIRVHPIAGYADKNESFARVATLPALPPFD
jgi:hypothetical protein